MENKIEKKNGIPKDADWRLFTDNIFGKDSQDVVLKAIWKIYNKEIIKRLHECYFSKTVVE